VGWLFLVPLAAALACLLIAIRDASKRGSRTHRLAWMAALALAAVAGCLGGMPWWLWLGALAFGLAVGALRSRRLSINVDHLWGLIGLRDTRAALAAAAALFGLLAIDITLSLLGRGESAANWLEALAAVAAGLLIGRTCITLIRVQSAPHHQMRSH
jgi:hypothetical protein